MGRRRWRWVAGGIAAVVALVVCLDLLEAQIRPPDGRTQEQSHADAEMLKMIRETGGETRRLTPDQWREMREWREKGTLTPRTPEQVAADHAVDEKMRRMLVRCGGDYRRLTADEKAFIFPYMKQGYPMPRVGKAR